MTIKPVSPSAQQHWLPALRTALVYAFVAGLWIFFSDQIISAVVHDDKFITPLQTVKEFFFIAVTALLIYYLIKRELEKQFLENLRHTAETQKLYDQQIRQQRERIELESRYQELLELLPHGVQENDLSGRITYSNRAHSELLGYRPSEVVGKYIWDFHTDPQSKEKLKTYFSYIVEHQPQPVPYYTKSLTREGREIDVQVDWTYKRNSRGEVVGFISIITDISERVKAEQELQASEERYRKLVEFSPAAIGIHVDGVIEYLNPAGMKILGARSADEVIGKPLMDFLHPSEEEQVKQRLEQLRMGKIKTLQELRGRRCTGEEFFISGISIPIGSGDPLRVQFVLFDVTETKRAEDALRKREEMYRRIVETANEGVWIIDEQARTTYVNQKMAEMLGYSVEEMEGSPLTDYLDDQEKERIKLRLERRRQGISAHYELKYLKRDGSELWAIVNTTPIFDDAGNYRGALAMISDITERVLAEKAWKEQVHRTEQILQATLDGYILADIEGVIKDVNPSYCRMIGYTREELLSKNIRDIEAHLSPEEVERRIAMMMESGSARFQTRHRHRNGRFVELDVSISMMTVDSGPLVAAFVRDITEEKKYQQELQASKQQYQALAGYLQSVREDERTAIAREIHDEFGQVLSVIKMDLSLIEDELASGKGSYDEQVVQQEIENIYQLIDRSIEQLNQLITRLRPEIIDTLGLVPALEWQTTEFTERMGLRGHFHSDVEQLQFGPDKNIALFRIVQEALTNVARHACAGKVSVSIRKQENGIILTVEDDGVGFSVEQALQANRFGLLGMRERAAILNAQLEIRSSKDNGTVIYLEIPIDEV